MIDIKINQLYTADKIENKQPRIPGNAFSSLHTLLMDKGETDAARVLNTITWDNPGTWGLYETESGKWAKRFESRCYKMSRLKLSASTKAIIGEHMKRWEPSIGKTVFFEFSKHSDWEHGAFEPKEFDPGPCWWNKYSSTRLGLTKNEKGYSVLFYKDKKQWEDSSEKAGTGRCWLYKVSPIHMVIFNAYGYLSLMQMAQAICQVMNLEYRQVTLSAELGYINKGSYNNEGRGGGTGRQNAGIGMLVGESISDYEHVHLPDFRVRDVKCTKCHNLFLQEDIHVTRSGKTYCHLCMGTLRVCSNCHELTEDENFISEYARCTDCYDRLPSCSNHGKTANATFRIYHTQRLACSRCLDEHRVFVCNICGNKKDSDKGREIRSSRTTYKFCLSCISKISTQKITENIKTRESLGSKYYRFVTSTSRTSTGAT